YGQGDFAAAAPAYDEALNAAPEGWPQYRRAVESALFAWQQIDSCGRTAVLARDAYPRLRRTASAANVAASGLDCALGLPAGDSRRAELVSALEADAREVVSDPSLEIAADDRSAAYISLLDARKDAHDDAGARRAAQDWASFLEGVASRARTADG